MAKGSETGGCLNCYAARMAARNMPGMRSPTTGEPFARMLSSGPRWTGEVELIPSALDWPLRKKKPLRIFVNSMSDLFHEKLSNEAIAAVFGVMAACPQHTFQVLTKRPEQMRPALDHMQAMARGRFLHPALIEHAATMAGSDRLFAAANRMAGRSTWPLPNVWLGTSVENQATADERIPHLLATPAAVRFVSYEPALGPVEFRPWLSRRCEVCEDRLGGGAFDNQVRKHGAQERLDVVSAPNRPCSHRLPPSPFDPGGVPSDVTAHGSLKPLDHLGVGVVNRDPRSGRAIHPQSHSDVPLTVEQAGDVSELRRVTGHMDRPAESGRSVSSERLAVSGQSPLDGGVGSAEVNGDLGNGRAPEVHRHDGINGQFNLTHDRHCISWLMVGGESGPGARPFDIAWARSTVEQCKAAGVACFVKQLGAKPFNSGGPIDAGFLSIAAAATALRITDRKGGDWTEWPEDLRVREFPG